MNATDDILDGGARVLITGAGGMVARELVPRLVGHYRLTLWDRRSVRVGGLMAEAVDLTDLSAVRGAMHRFDAVVHLAIASYREILFGGAAEGVAKQESHDAFHDAMMVVNNAGTLHLMKAASEVGIPRFVFMSSVTIVSQGLVTGSIAVDQPAVPRDVYACTKLFGETLGRYFSAHTPMKVVCLRLGQPYPVDHPAVIRDFRNKRAWLVHHDDIAEGVRCAIQADVPSFTLHNLVSAQAGDYFPESEIVSHETGFVPSCRIEADGSVSAGVYVS